MSVKIKSSLMVDRRVRLEEAKALEEKKSDRVPPGNSTPKRSKTPQVLSQEPLIQDYISSPIQLTQEPNNEVAWDWQSTRAKPKAKSKPEASSTPKRSRASHKKRNSNSPLVYKPFKKRIIKNEDVASIDKWKNEFLALDAQMESGAAQTAAASSHETIKENSEENISDDLFFDDDFEFEDDKPVIVIEDSPEVSKASGKTEKSSSTSAKLVVQSKEKESMDDLFDDSINEESMLRCSQEIEEKLKIGTLRTEPARETKKYGLSCGVAQSNLKPSASTSSPSSSKFKKYKSDPIDTNSSRNQRSSSKETKDAFADCEDFDIPDDSFDEIALTASLDDVKPPPKATEMNQTKNVNSSTKPQRNGGHFANSVVKAASFQAKGAVKTAPAPPQNLISQSRGALSGNAAASSSQMTTGNKQRFFKARNHSDTSFDNSNRSGTAEGSSNRSGKGVGRTVSMNMDIRRTNSLDQREFRLTKENSNCPLNNFDRLKLKEDGDKRSGGCSVPRSQTTMCTPQEIERKRLEAKKKLEAKKRMNNIQNSVKR